MESLIGQTLGRYRIEASLGEGGMGAVYRARHVDLQNDWAIKVMRRDLAEQPDFRRRFLQEARTAAQLDHPGIVKVVGFDEARGFHYIVMEYIAGGNLHQYLMKLHQQRKWLPVSEAIFLVQQIAQALDHAHRQGILHRDIKPANIMLKVDPQHRGRLQPVITDLGLAKLRDGGVTTQADVALGTPAYMSPEQASGYPVDARSDVYSLGILLYELTVGKRPFPITSITEAIRYHTREQPPLPSALRSDLPKPLEQIILRSIAKKPEQRFPSTGALAQALAKLPVESLPSGAPPSAPSGAVSLVTQIQESTGGQRGSSVMRDFPSQKPGKHASQAQIQIMAPDGSTQTVAIQPGRITVGRDPRNDIVVKENRISRRHLQIDYDGRRFTITDLKSANKTYLGKKAIEPGIATRWSPDQAVQIGKHYLRIVPAQANATQIYDDNSYASTRIAETEIMGQSVPVEPIQRPRWRLPVWATTLLATLVFASLGGGGWYLFRNGLPFNIVGPRAVTFLSATDTPTATPSAAATPSATLTSTPTPSATATAVPPTATRTATVGITELPPPVVVTATSEQETPTVPNVTRPPTSTPAQPPTPTPRPTSTNTAMPTPTPTPRPIVTLVVPTLTPRVPTSTSTPPHHDTTDSGFFRVEMQVICDGQRGYSWFGGTVYVNGQPASGYIVAFYSRRGSDTFRVEAGRPGWSAGYYEHLGQTDKFVSRAWRAYIEGADGKPISEYADWDSDGTAGSCNRAEINFYR